LTNNSTATNPCFDIFPCPSRVENPNVLTSGLPLPRTNSHLISLIHFDLGVFCIYVGNKNALIKYGFVFLCVAINVTTIPGGLDVIRDDGITLSEHCVQSYGVRFRKLS